MRRPLAILKPQARTAETIADEMRALAAERAAVERELHDRENDRDRVVGDGTLDEMHEHDIATGKLRLRIEQADARYVRLADEHAAAREREEQDRRAEAYKSGERARREAVKLLADYESAARSVAEILRRLGEHEATIAAANAALPAGADAIDTAEPFNGTAYQPPGFTTYLEDVTVDEETGLRAILGGIKRMGLVTRRREMQMPTPMVMGVPHTPLRDTVHLPGLGRNAAPIWQGQRR